MVEFEESELSENVEETSVEGIVDRIEENNIVIETDSGTLNVEKEKAQDDVKDGDVVTIIIISGCITSVVKNEEKTLSREAYINDLTKDMWE